MKLNAEKNNFENNRFLNEGVIVFVIVILLNNKKIL